MVLTHATVVPITELPLQITHVQSLVTGLNLFSVILLFYFGGDLNASACAVINKPLS